MTEKNRPRFNQDPAHDPEDSFPHDGEQGEGFGLPHDSPHGDAGAPGSPADSFGEYDPATEDAYGPGAGAAYEGAPVASGDAYDDAYAFPAQEGSAAAGVVGVAGAGTVSVDQEPPEKSGPPLRGLAMILTAVAVVLIIWGAWSLFSGDDDAGPGDKGTAAETGSSASAGAPTPSAVDGQGENAPEPPAVEAPVEGPVAGPAVDRASTRVTVLNNSANDPIAAPAAERLRANGWSTTGYGNLSGRVEGISEQSRVYYPEGDAAAQAAAEEVGAELGLPVMAGNSDYYDRFGEASIREGGGADGVVVVLTGAVA